MPKNPKQKIVVASKMQPTWVIVGVSLWMATVCNLALWQELQKLGVFNSTQGSKPGIVLVVTLVLMLTALLVVLISLLAWRWTLKPFVMLLLSMAALGTYFMLSYGVVIDETMITNALQTDFREANDLLNWRMAAALLLLALPPMVVLWRAKLNYGQGWHGVVRNLLVIVVALAGFSGALLMNFQSFSTMMRTHTHVRMLLTPLNIVYALGQVATHPFRRDEKKLLPFGTDAQLGSSYEGQTKPPLLILALGETARVDKFSINGYARSTTPELTQLYEAGQMASHHNAWSCGTSTAASVPCMFSHLGREGYGDRKANYENLLDILQHAGLAVLWIDNQAGCKEVCDRVASASTTQLKLPNLCSDSECFDEVMLQNLDARINALPAEQRAKGIVIVMHQMGSHGPAYFKRSPAEYKPFKPECDGNAVQECSQESVINAYDNTIAYTDHVLGSTIKWLQQQGAQWQTAMVYVSDHGESLGENNLYLHGMPYAIAPDVQKRVPWLTWLSPEFQTRSKLTIACLRQQQDEPISHDNYFHSILGLMDVKTAAYQVKQDIYASCIK